MAQYRVLQRSFIGNRLVDEGDVVDYEGEPSDNLECIDDAPSKKGKKPTPPDAPPPAGEDLV